MKRFKNLKIYCKDTSATIDIVSLIMKKGYDRLSPLPAGCCFLYLDSDGMIRAAEGGSKEYAAFKKSSYREVDINDLKKENLIEKREFDIKPFDRVLVRPCKGSGIPWRCDIFSNTNMCEDAVFTCVGDVWGEIVKYEGNQHYISTTRDIENSWSKEDIS